MNIENLKEYIKITNIIPNYKKVCEVLELSITSGNSKISQLKELERFISYHKEGNKFIIDEIYDIPLEKIDGRENNIGGANNVTEYTKNIEKLILNLLVQGSKNKIGFGKVFLSKNQLLKEFEMINDNYVYCKRRTLKLSKFMNINQETVEEWYDITDNMLERNLEQSLKSLENKSLIFWSKEITVAETIAIANLSEDATQIIKTTVIDSYGEENVNYKYYASEKVILNYREGTDYEKTFIYTTEREILKELKCESKQEIIKRGMWDIFKEKVDKIVLKELNIAFYYKSYKILFNEKHINEVVEDTYESFELSKESKTNEQSILNKEIIDRNITNAEKRQIKAIREKSKIFGKNKDDFQHNRIERRAKENYLDDNKKLNNNLIIKNAIDIKEDVKKIKIEDKSIDDIINKIFEK